MASSLSIGVFIHVVVVVVVSIATFASSTPLKVGFYQSTCNSAELIVKQTVTKAMAQDPGAAAALVRLHFHDCFVRGCDASVLLDSTPGNSSEKENSMNLSLQGFQIIDEAKAAIEAQCPGMVSCADIVAFAARDSAFEAGRIHYNVPAGRRDGRVSLKAEPSDNLPAPTFNVEQLKANFARKGLSMEEMVTLSGAHTIGTAGCSAFSDRLYNFEGTHLMDPTLNQQYGAYLKTMCHGTSSDQNVSVSFDPVTPNRLDNMYYNNLRNHKGLLSSDQALTSNKQTAKMVTSHASHPAQWSAKFAAAMVRMGSIDVLTGSQGEIRKNCRVVN